MLGQMQQYYANEFKRRQFDQMMEEHVREGGVVVSAGLDIFRAGRDGDFNSIFERADQRMYEKKKYLKSLKTDAAPATPA